MSEFQFVQPQVAPEVEHARDLQLRLYREIGMSAVAAALDVGLDAESPSEAADAAVLQHNESIAA